MAIGLLWGPNPDFILLSSSNLVTISRSMIMTVHDHATQIVYVLIILIFANDIE